MTKVIFDRNGESGNIFWVMGAAYAALLQEGRRQDAEAMREKVCEQESYEAALEVIAEFVDLVDMTAYVDIFFAE